jgi:exosome complex RNA-binding protein Rrp42 (RNase PH superfamily)
VESYWAKETRSDGRLLLQCRPTSVEPGIVQPSYASCAKTHTFDDDSSSSAVTPNAAGLPVVAGSSLVRIGDTQVLAVVTLQVGFVVVSSTSTTSAATSGATSRSGRGAGGGRSPMGGDVVITCSYRDLLSASSSSSVDPSMTSYLQRVIEENADLEQLYIDPQHDASTHTTTTTTNTHAGVRTGAEAGHNRQQPQAFRLCVGVEVLVDGGNVRDAALLACTSALADTRLPPTAAMDPSGGGDGDIRVKLVLPSSNRNTIDGGHQMKRLSCPRLPVPLTVGLWESIDGSCQLIVDPNKEEQAALSGMITVVVDAAAQGGEACVVSTEMTGRADLAALALAVKLAQGRAKELLPVLLRP